MTGLLYSGVIMGSGRRLRVLLLSGEGPYFKNASQLQGSLFDISSAVAPELGVGLHHLAVDDHGTIRQALRTKKGVLPHLTTFTLQSILDGVADYELFRLEGVWTGEAPPTVSFDVVLLSTTFICDRLTLRTALSWIVNNYPNAAVILGGQYSNLKYIRILADHPEVDYIVRGDAEEALPRLLSALEGEGDLGAVPNLVYLSGGEVVVRDIEYVDLERYPSPVPRGATPTVPYESMRGCPFRCKFCSFPSASPLWRFKSARKIAGDWASYVQQNQTSVVRAMDSTFTVPPARLRDLLRLLPGVGVRWEAYSRANSLHDAAVVESLAEANCKLLSIGFESMSDRSLGYMDKLVTADQNRRAHQLLKDSPIDYRVSFIVGYPGETPEDYAETYKYLVDEFTGRFMLSVFSMVDETMPVWRDADKFQLQIDDPDDPDYAWRHSGMDVQTARNLQAQTVRDVRWRSEHAVHLLWQTDFETPIVPWRSRRDNLRIEKLIERLSMAPVDFTDRRARVRAMIAARDELEAFGIVVDPALGDHPVRLPELHSVGT